ncbi:hypothetical protein, partial [Kitasatospora sp. NPDC007106]|uniref:hypothetical protein n=1 Tax=Kitasatospora sp. NPDC007106 TaxID=3156914 RepID=UPI0033F3F3CF
MSNAHAHAWQSGSLVAVGSRARSGVRGLRPVRLDQPRRGGTGIGDADPQPSRRPLELQSEGMSGVIDCGGQAPVGEGGAGGV